MGFITINRKLSFLRKLLNVAASQENPIIEKLPPFKGLLVAEMGRARTGTIDAEDFAAILAHMNRLAQRYLIALHETAMRRDEPRAVTWDKVDLKAGLIRLTADDVKEKHPQRTLLAGSCAKYSRSCKPSNVRSPI